MDAESTDAPYAYFAPLATSKYMSLSTFKRSGQRVDTAVHVVLDGDAAVFRTWDKSGKAKRIKNNPAVEVAPSSGRGKARGPALGATAVLLEGAASEAAGALLAKAHPILHGLVIPRAHRLRGWVTQQYRLDRPA